MFALVTALGQSIERGTTLEVDFDGMAYPAEALGGGAAYELFADRQLSGFLRNPRPGARWPFRRFVHASEVSTVLGADEQAEDDPLVMPVSRALDWAVLHRMSQTPYEAGIITAIRGTATIRRGTRMIKFLSARQFYGHLRGRPISGFCYRAYDVAHLRTPADVAVLAGEPLSADAPVAFALRWRAVDPADYAVPFATDFSGLVTMPPHDRIGPPIIGNGFAPTDRHLIPEFVTVDVADLPLTANCSLMGYTPDGTEVTLYTYLPEQRAWVRMYGPQWRHLFADMPASEAELFPADQDYIPIPPTLSRYIGQYRGSTYDAIADPPGEFRVAAKIRAARYPVDALARRIPYASWRDVPCTATRAEGGWLRLRLCRPDGGQVTALSAQCIERGVYEVWAPASEVVDACVSDFWYTL